MPNRFQQWVRKTLVGETVPTEQEIKALAEIPELKALASERLRDWLQRLA